MRMRKGDLVQLDVKKCFTVESGGERKYPRSNYECDEKGIVYGERLPTSQDYEAWRKSDDSKGMDCAGETKLPPTSYYVKIPRGNLYLVLRARCRANLSYGNPTPGLALIRCSATGEEAYVKRDLLEVVSPRK